MMPDGSSMIIGAGLLLGMLYYARTGESCGGIITPGILALSIHEPVRIVLSLGVALVVMLLLEMAVRLFGFYGRQRIALAMLIALLLKVLFSGLMPASSLWLGWVVPGLMAADMQRQGMVPTFAGAISVTVASAMVAGLAQGVAGL